MSCFFYEIIVENIPTVLTYSHNLDLLIGTIVFVNIRGTERLAIVFQKITEIPKKSILPIARTTNLNVGVSLVNFIRMLSSYTLYHVSVFIKAIIPNFYGRKKLDTPSRTVKKKKKECDEPEQEESVSKFTINTPINLNVDQEQAFNQITGSSGYKTLLLYGSTGSGKTEICIAAVIKTIEQGKQVLILLPEIALITQWVNRIQKYINCEIVIHHSLKGKSKKSWENAISNKTPIVIGARSSIFLPFENLGLIIVDEEHDSSYKQDTKPIYHGRDAAVMRAYHENCTVILASATPSLESLSNVEQKKYELVNVKNKFFQGAKTSLEFVSTDTQILSERVLRMIKSTYLDGKKTIIFVNRRGYGKKVICLHCKSVMQCKFCDYAMVYHRFNDKYLCHLCNYEKKDRECDSCKNSNMLQSYGVGVETVEEFINNKLPDMETLIFSSDTTNSKSLLEDKIQEINNDKPSIIIGTQMLSKGHDLANLSLVIISDLNIANTDFRGKERAIQLLTQILGRVGRREGNHKAIIQMDLNTPFADFLMKNFINSSAIEYREILKQELLDRRQWMLPPFVSMINIYIQHKNQETAAKDANHVFDLITMHNLTGLRVSLPVTMPIARKNSFWRYVVSLSMNKKQHLSTLSFFKNLKIKSDITIDVNPLFSL